jgi:hypothetical protein
MNGKLEIISGHFYWVQLEGVRLRLVAIRETKDNPGWWECRAPHGTSIMAEVKDFVSLAEDTPTTGPIGQQISR